jgi:FkbM family methyltransferase
MRNRLRGCANIGSIRLPIDHTVLSRRMERRLARGRYEPSVAAAAMEMVRDGDTVVELGGGLGYISAYLRRHTGAGRIVSYEANPHLISYARDVHRHSSALAIEVRHAVVLPVPSGATMPFYIRSDFAASSLNESDGQPDQVVDVPVTSWSDVLDEIKPTVAIVDIEGGELDLLEAGDFDPVQRLVLETHPALYGTRGMKRLYAALAKHGFEYRSLYHVRGSTAPVIALERQDAPTARDGTGVFDKLAVAAIVAAGAGFAT